MEQEDQDQQVEVRVLQEESSKLQSLKEHAGYAYLMQIAQGQLTQRAGNVLLKALRTMDEVLEQEFQKGEYSGIRLFTEIVDLRIEDLKQQIAERMKEDEEVVD